MTNIHKNPLSKFISDYAASDAVRLHMPGHKGRFGEISKEDITEIKGADELYEAEGIIAESEKRASEIFDSGATFFSTEGSSQVIKAMCLLTMQYESFGIAETKAGAGKPLIVAGRNAHRAFVSAMELLDFDVEWLWPENESEKVGDFISLCECRITTSGLRSVLENLRMSGRKAAAVYITSPDYLGNISDIKALAEIAHEFGSILICDNAHGSYLKFIKLDCSLHPIDLGVDLVCDSAHKTLPVLTGGAYLHMGKAFAEKMSAYAKSALLRFGSTSPSYLILKSLDEANTFLAEEAEKHLYELTAEKVAGLRKKLEEIGFVFYGNEPLKLTIDVRQTEKINGLELAEKLRNYGIELEYADRNFLVMMWSPFNTDSDFERTEEAFKSIMEKQGYLNEKQRDRSNEKECDRPNGKPETVFTPRQVLLMPREKINVSDSLGRVAAELRLSCPPAVLPVIPGERIDEKMIEVMEYYGIEEITVLK